ncbi:multicopper oxidase domain-containing protein [Micromonospora auratinigra]|uniref:Multicopper oxidase n=1 Tax=Micromonospora auratinigra TaxID=261654 RepID=A0A1A8Z849_9ACTN|nr:multicopper oxidase domain-containing protein [Micromonospora auratinigra]SBT40044.1 Multicopper oxidase [Micromonospora auratinigra]
MTDPVRRPGISRRALLAGLTGAGTWAVLPESGSDAQVRRAAAVLPRAVPRPAVSLHLAATDGWVSMPQGSPPISPFWPDPLAPAGADLYVFGFRDVTGLSATEVTAQRGKAQISAPLLGFDQETDIKITLSNLGLSQRPDLVDGHTVHWHGFRNAIPLFDGVPELSISVPIGREFTYFYRPHDAGTYMYHCHFEDVEHVQMGMTGIVYVRPAQNAGTADVPPAKYAYNDGDGTTRYDREFALMLTEVWAEAHYRDAHIQTTDWTDYKPSFFAFNGRCHPDTLAPNGDPLSPAAGRLRYQPISSLITANAGERVLLRLANLGYQNHTLTVDGLDLLVVGKDAALLRGRDGSAEYQVTSTVQIGPGESRDVILTAPDPGTYLLYDRDLMSLANAGGGRGGQLTEIRISPPGTLPAQTRANA